MPLLTELVELRKRSSHVGHVDRTLPHPTRECGHTLHTRSPPDGHHRVVFEFLLRKRLAGLVYEQRDHSGRVPKLHGLSRRSSISASITLASGLIGTYPRNAPSGSEVFD